VCGRLGAWASVRRSSMSGSFGDSISNTMQYPSSFASTYNLSLSLRFGHFMVGIAGFWRSKVFASFGVIWCSLGGLAVVGGIYI
jgi:hypothetical protein